MIDSLYKFVMLPRPSEKLAMVEKGNKGGVIDREAKLEGKKMTSKEIFLMANLPI